MEAIGVEAEAVDEIAASTSLVSSREGYMGTSAQVVSKHLALFSYLSYFCWLQSRRKDPVPPAGEAGKKRDPKSD